MKKQILFSVVATLFAASSSFAAVDTDSGAASALKASTISPTPRTLVAPDIKVIILPGKIDGDKNGKLRGDKTFPPKKQRGNKKSPYKIGGDKVFPQGRTLAPLAKATIDDPELLAFERRLLETNSEYRELREGWIELMRERILSKDAFRMANNAAIRYFAHLRANPTMRDLASLSSDLVRYEILLEDGTIRSSEFAWLVSGLFTTEIQ